MNVPNGNNAGNGASVGGAVTPAGYQAELNYIWGLVEELSKQLNDNRKKTEDIVSNIGKIRQGARDHNTSSEELIEGSAEKLSAQNANLEEQISIMNESLDKAKHSRDSNMKLLQEFRQVMEAMLQQFHTYKAQHLMDVSAWHQSYRAQLADARAENCRLREQIWDMQEHAGNAHEQMRLLRKHLAEDETLQQRRIDDVAHRQEVRFWKRMAMPQVPDDDPSWSDDDDLVDIQEKIRLSMMQSDMVVTRPDDMEGENDLDVDNFDDGGMMDSSLESFGNAPSGSRSLKLSDAPQRPMTADSTGSTNA
ncbi:hypothetical protein TD95_001579 [Thielaviopsis punctulata]|uniref:Uncharacterized protein n=1 Tax=Thielaviopsis punctulata TaxID=72032 RepID=A0A0F4ZH03_9PEZI|nr:hypothetical protein TD95_001579 [Thielaviopsis punctulata]